VYPIFATGARNWVLGVNLYEAHDGLDIYRYSPLVTVLFVPLTWLPEALGGVIWRLANVGVFLAALRWWCRAALPLSLNRTYRAYILLLVVIPALSSINNGQSNLMVIGLLMAAVAALAEERWNFSAAMVALAGFFKVYPISLGLLLALLYARRFGARLALALLVGLALPFLFQEPSYVSGQYAQWANHLQNDDRQTRPRELWYRDVRLLDWVWGRSVDAQSYQVIELASAGAIAALCLLGRRGAQPRRRDLAQMFVLASCWMTLFGPATEPSTYTLLAPALAWSLLEAWLLPRALGSRLLISTSYGLFLAYNLAGWFPGKVAFRNFGPDALAALLLFGCAVVMTLASLRWPRKLPRFVPQRACGAAG
jgi:hypothetical protein